MCKKKKNEYILLNCFWLCDYPHTHTHTQIQEHRAALEYQQAAMEAKPAEEHHHQVLDHFPFLGDQQPSSVLQLATNSIPHQIHPYHHLQLAQPNLQDPNV